MKSKEWIIIKGCFVVTGHCTGWDELLPFTQEKLGERRPLGNPDKAKNFSEQHS